MKILPTGTYEKKVCFDSGREVLASEGLISIDEHGDLWDGSDGDFRAYDPPLTPAERRDLADFMIERWQRWAGLTEDELDDDSARWAVHRFARHWQCPCGAKLTVRSATERDDGPSNFRLQSDPTQPSFGHATLPSDQLNWAGLAEERGWLRGADGRLRCTACAQGVPFRLGRHRRRI